MLAQICAVGMDSLALPGDPSEAQVQGLAEAVGFLRQVGGHHPRAALQDRRVVVSHNPRLLCCVVCVVPQQAENDKVPVELRDKLIPLPMYTCHLYRVLLLLKCTDFLATTPSLVLRGTVLLKQLDLLGTVYPGAAQAAKLAPLRLLLGRARASGSRYLKERLRARNGQTLSPPVCPLP